MKQTFNYRDCTITIHPDDSAESPDAWGDQSLFLVGFHRDFFVRRKGFEQTQLADDESLAIIRERYHVIPLRAYIHSGVALSLGTSYPFNCPWDSMWVGAVLAAKQEWPTPEAAEYAAQSLVNEWNDYLSGNVWSYESEDAQGDVVGSCGGFYGDVEVVLGEAQREIDGHAKRIRKAHQDRLKTWIRHRVPLAARQACPGTI